MAARGIFEHAVLHPVQRVAGLKHGVVDRWILRRRNVTRLGLVRLLRDPHLSALYARRGPIGRAGDDAVVIVGEALRLYQRLPPASRAAVPIRARWPLAVI